jgi:hypothetical protein
MDNELNKRIWKSYVWHGEKCFLVSTIERTYDTCEGSSRGCETLVWEYDWEKHERGRLVHQGGGVVDHQRVCRCVIAEGEIPDEDNPKHARFFSA